MGMLKKFMDKVQQTAKDKLTQDQDPQVQKAAKKEANKKTAERAVKAAKIVKQGVEAYNHTAKKLDEAVTDVTQKTITLAEHAKPLAEKIDGAISTAGEEVKDAFGNAQKKIQDKVADLKKGAADKPSTGSGILDLLLPGIPETDATRPKPAKDAPPSP